LLICSVLESWKLKRIYSSISGWNQKANTLKNVDFPPSPKENCSYRITSDEVEHTYLKLVEYSKQFMIF